MNVLVMICLPGKNEKMILYLFIISHQWRGYHGIIKATILQLWFRRETISWCTVYRGGRLGLFSSSKMCPYRELSSTCHDLG
mmetsp:Transcript_14061/g.50491  ORF Transcript_14061/g.50491 Transcript_14061/m.50491 type:complete len:82 (+) Transcript_14061:1486-1731(+)